MPKTAEIAFNSEFAKLLRSKHPRWHDRIGVEQTNVFTEAAALQPDIIVLHPGGLPVNIETEFTPAHTVEQDARQRLGKTLKQTGDCIEQAIAVRIPSALASTSQSGLEKEIQKTELEFCILSGNPENPDRWPKAGWLQGTVDDLSAFIELAALSENRISQGMQILEEGIDQAAGKLREACTDAPGTLTSIAQELHQKDGPQTSRMAMAILANALTFHSAVAGAHEIDTLDQIRDQSGRLSKRRLLECWRHVLTNINYWPIFKIASDILLPIRNGTAQEILGRLSMVATELVSLGATSQHDLCGRMFQRLISDRKFLATFYTFPSSAALLAELAVARLDMDWSDRDALTALRIADLACGTGALLNATYQAVLSRYRRKGGDDREIHPEMIEHALVGTDIMPAATHLTASVLSSTHPTVTFGNTSIVTLPYGEQPQGSGRPIAIGALDLIEDQQSPSLFGTGRKRLRGVGDSEDEQVHLLHNEFDLVIMNPPFTRSTGHEAEKIGIPAPAFAGFSTSDEEMRLMSRRLKQIRKPSMVGNGNAGLASNFIDLAHVKLKSPGGVLALVLPATFLRGAAWSAARRLLDQDYKDVTLVTITATGTNDRAFSADTGMAEVLVIATKKGKGVETDDSAHFVNLRRRPQTILEATTVARAVQRVAVQDTPRPIAIGSEERVGRSIPGVLANTGAAGLREAAVAEFAKGLQGGELRFPRQAAPVAVPVTELSNLGRRGLYHMDISGKERNKSGIPRGPFDIVRLQSGDFPTWPALWSHNARREKRLVVMPDSAAEVRPECADLAIEAWRKTASRLHFNRDFQINSQPLSACLTADLSIGGRAWPNFQCADRRWETPLLLWANTTIGLICFWWNGTRQQKGRAVLTISKLPGLRVLDTRSLTTAQLDHADEIFDTFRNQDMLPANEAWRDKTRQALDGAILTDLLGLPKDLLESLELIRRQWCAEPSVHGGKNTGPESQQP